MSHYGIVFWIICLFGGVSILVFLERFLHLRRAQIDYRDVLKGVCNVLEKNNTEEAMMLCEETPGPAAVVVLTAIRHRNSTQSALAEAVSNTEAAEVSRMERRLSFLALSCQIAPLLGLLGTFFGAVDIIQALQQQAPIVQNTDLVSGLLQAFSATIAGLIVAIECHLFHAFLTTRIEQLILDMEACGSEIIAYLTQQDKSML